MLGVLKRTVSVRMRLSETVLLSTQNTKFILMSKKIITVQFYTQKDSLSGPMESFGRNSHLCKLVLAFIAYLCRDFPRPDLGPNIGPFPIQKQVKTSKNGVYHT